MKKLIFLLVIMWGFQLQAQDNGIFDNDKEQQKSRQNFESGMQSSYMYGPGDISLEVGFDPRSIFNASSGGDMFGFIGNQLRYRKFNVEGNAFRMGMGIHYVRLSNVVVQATDDDPALHEYVTDWGISLMPGYEKHFHVSPRFSPYMGYQVLFGYHRTSYAVEHLDGSTVYQYKWINDPSKTGYGSMDIGAGFITGFDYFIVKHLYVGLELGLGFQYSHFLDTQFVDEGDSDNNETYENGSAIILAPGLTSGFIRLGWVF